MRTPLYLVGLGEAWAADDEPAAAVAAVPGGQPRLVFMHNPNSYDSLPSGTAPLAIAAHTHAGQLRVPAVRWLRLARGYEVHSAGWISGFGEPGNRLHVNRGLGMSGVPIRIGARPELTVFTLRAPAPKIGVDR